MDFVRYLPISKGDQIEVGVRLAESRAAARELCERWITQVHEPFIEGDAIRADADWDWDVEIPLLTFRIGMRRRPRMLQLYAIDGDFPLGMVALLENERWIADRRRSASFLWYLSGAPASAFEGRPVPKMITAATIDMAVTISLNGAADGRLWLHAAPEGGDRLLEWYKERGLEQVPQTTKLPGPLVGPRRNDGRYFRLTQSRARVVSARLNEYRT